jgi:hypothetical protein
MNTEQTIILARKLLDDDFKSQARFCLENALKYRDSGWFYEAKRWALISIECSKEGKTK